MTDSSDRTLHLEIYKQIFETWRYEVNSYWQRNNYFLAFETGTLGGCWYIIERGHFVTAFIFSLLGVVSALIWRKTSLAVHFYVDYWWQSVKKLETVLGLQSEDLAFASRNPGSGKHPSKLVHQIPILFSISWLVTAGFAAYYLATRH